jgi:hypothetical protein
MHGHVMHAHAVRYSTQTGFLRIFSYKPIRLLVGISQKNFSGMTTAAIDTTGTCQLPLKY